MSSIQASPYNPGIPVNRANFAGRQGAIADVHRGLLASRDGNPTSIFVRGEWGIGKTSLLLKVTPILEEYGLVVREDVPEGTKFDQNTVFFNAMIDEMTGASPGAEGYGAEPVVISGFDDIRSLRKALKNLMEAIWEHDHLVPVIMLDNLERADPEFLSGIKDVFQRLAEEGVRYLLLFAGKTLPGTGNHASDPIARFFQTIDIGPMSEEESLEAILKPIEKLANFSISEFAGRLIHERAAGHPYFLKQICHHIFALADGKGNIDVAWLEEMWPRIEANLGVIKFDNEFAQIPEAEKETLMHASLLGFQFRRADIPADKASTLDSSLRRLVKERGLLRPSARGIYEFYHPLFRNFVIQKAREAGFEIPGDLGLAEIRKEIALGESDQREFKSTLFFDLRSGNENDEITKSALKTIVAFRNGKGGKLYLGVEDDGNVLGLESDFPYCGKKKNREGFELKLLDLVRDRIKPYSPNIVDIGFVGFPEGEICVVNVPRGKDITYLKMTPEKGKPDNVLFVREGPRTVSLDGPDLERFIRGWEAE